jgi:ABC-2 type transport system permease protein
MRELRIVLHREFSERVRSRSFILSTLLTPLFILAVGLGPTLLARAPESPALQLMLVDETGDGIGTELQVLLRASAPEGENGFRTMVVTDPLPQIRDSLTALVTAGRIDAYLHLPPALTDIGQVQLWTRVALSAPQRQRITAAAGTAVQAERLRQAGLSPTEVGGILRPVSLTAIRLTSEGEREQSDAGLIFAFLMSFFLYMLILLYGTQVMQSVHEEKTNRIAEVLVSSIRAPHLMIGKVLGVGSVALLQITIWIALATLFLWQRQRLVGLGVAAEVFGPLLEGADPTTLATLLAYILLGFFLYATLFAAVGAASETTEDAQRFTFPLVTPLFLPLILGERIVTAPAETTAVVLSWIPFTTPLVMPMRLAAGGATALEALATIAYLAACVAALGWLAGKVYRVGILSTGKRVGWRDLARWVRMD